MYANVIKVEKKTEEIVFMLFSKTIQLPVVSTNCQRNVMLPKFIDDVCAER